MGTSVNQSSPKTLNWDAVHAGYRNPEVPVDRIASEVWRAATNQPLGDLESLLSAPIVARVGQLALRARNVSELTRAAASEIVRTKSSSLGADIARRAAVQCLVSRDRTAAYYQRLFAEATSYLVARDFPGFVGSGRARTVPESLQFRAAVEEHVAAVVNRVRGHRDLETRSWRKNVRDVIKALQGKPR